MTPAEKAAYAKFLAQQKAALGGADPTGGLDPLAGSGLQVGPDAGDPMSAVLNDPETLKKFLGLGTLDERGDLLQQQRAQAQALRNAPAQNYSTGLGAALGGLGNVIGGISGGLADNSLAEQQKALLGAKDAGRLEYAKALADALRRQKEMAAAQQPAPAPQASSGAPTPEMLAAMFGR